jgi:hypothetical protein
MMKEYSPIMKSAYHMDDDIDSSVNQVRRQS